MRNLDTKVELSAQSRQTQALNKDLAVTSQALGPCPVSMRWIALAVSLPALLGQAVALGNESLGQDIVTEIRLEPAQSLVSGDNSSDDLEQESGLKPKKDTEVSRRVDRDLADDLGGDGAEDFGQEETSANPLTVFFQHEIALPGDAPRVIETILGEKLLPAATNRKPEPTQAANDAVAVVLPILSDAVPQEILQDHKLKYRAMLGESLKGIDVDARYAGTLLNRSGAPQKNESFAAALLSKSSPQTSEPEALAKGKVYSVVDGKIVEVRPFDLKATAPVARQEPKIPAGWLIQAYQESATAPQALSDIFSQQGTLNAQFSTPAAAPDKGSMGGDVALPVSAMTQAYGFTAAQGGTNALQAARTVSVRGHVSVPAGFDAKKINVRIAGTSWQIKAESDGLFEFQDIPAGSKFDLVVWDDDNMLVRRIVPVSASAFGRDFDISLARTSFVNAVATAFGVQQENTLSGFCGRLSASSKLALEGAKATLGASKNAQGPFFYNANGLPDAALKEASPDGRFCVFNARSELVKVHVRLLNGARRTFTVHLEPTTFETSLEFGVDHAIYRPVQSQELVDSTESIAAQTSDSMLNLGELGDKKWIMGLETPVWSKVSDVYLRTDASYSPQFLDQKTTGQLQFFPVGQEFVEVAWSSDSQFAAPAYQLISQSDLLTQKIMAQKTSREANLAAGLVDQATGGSPIFQDSSEHYVVKMLDGDTATELEKLVPSEHSQRLDRGMAFVSLNLAALGLEYADVRLALRDPWTGKGVAEFHMIPLPEGTRSSRYIRGFFGNVPEGQFTLLVTDKEGVLKWIDVVRSHAGGMQVLSIRE